MQSYSSNEFIGAPAGSRSYRDNSGEDDFDVARISAIRKEQKEELEHLDRHYNGRQAAIETQVRGEVDHLFQQFQVGMQQLYANLTKTVGITIENQVQHRLEQEQLRREHDSKKGEVEARFQIEASKLIISTSHAGRHLKPPLVPSQGPITHSASRQSSFSATNVGRHISPAPSSVNRTPPGQHRIPQRSLTSDHMPRQHVPQQPPFKDFLVPLPTPMPTPEDLMPNQRRLAAAEPRDAERHHAETRSVEARSVEPRSVQPRHNEYNVETSTEPRVKTPPVEPHRNEKHQGTPRQVEQRYAESRSAEQHHVEQHIERSFGEQSDIEQRQAGSHSAKGYHTSHHIEQDPAKLNHVGQHSGQHTGHYPPVQQSTESHTLKQRQVERLPNKSVAAQIIYEEPRQIKEPPTTTELDKSFETLSNSPTATPPRQQSKRKAAETTTSEQANVAPSSKRSRTREAPTDTHLDTQIAMDKSPRSTRRSSGVATGIVKETRDKTAKRTVTFQEVYQDGKAQFKHKIFAWPRDCDDWYIVRCDEHQVHFNNTHPLHGAAKHVHSPQHGNLEKRHDLAMEICGYRVLNCDSKLAELNNLEFDRALKEDKYQVFNMNLLNKEERRLLVSGPAHADATSSLASTSTFAKNNSKPPIKPDSAITKPEEGNFYLGFWAPTKKWYMLIVLPIRPDGSLREVGLKEKLQQTDLMSNVPKCYRSDRISLRITGWQPTYSDGGAKADKREYPVMFFDSPVQKHSLGWLPATKLRPVDLYNPPDDADTRGLALARDWYAFRMRHGDDWEQLKRLGPGEPPSPSASEGDSGKSEQWTTLRSAHIDDMSPIRDKSNGPGQFFGSGSSDEGSDLGDAENPMTMDIGPIPEPADSNYVDDSASDDSDVGVEMGDAPRGHAAKNVNDAIRPRRRKTSTQSASGHHVPGHEMNINDDKNKQTTIAGSETDATQSNDVTQPTEVGNQTRSTVVPELDQHKKSAQAKALAAVKEAAIRSRAYSESPEVLKSHSALTFQQQQQQQQPAKAPASDARPTFACPPPLANYSNSKAKDSLAHNTSRGTNEVNETRSNSELHSNVSGSQGSSQGENLTETHIDPYKRFEAIRAQMSGLSSRPASVPVNMGSGVSKDSPFGPPTEPAQHKEVVSNVAQQPPNESHIMSPPLSQSSAMIPARSSSSTPTHGLDSGRNTPRIVILEDTSRWKTVHSSSVDLVQQPGEVSASKSLSPTPATSAQAIVQPIPQLGTPIHDKQETFDVSQLYGPEGISWIREGPNKPFLRLITDPMRKWAETTRESTLKANIEPAQVQWIETDHPEGDKDKQRVRLMTKHNREVVLIFETNSANGRSQKAVLQGRKFVTWVKRMNEKVEWRDVRSGSRREAYVDERRSMTVE